MLLNNSLLCRKSITLDLLIIELWRLRAYSKNCPSDREYSGMISLSRQYTQLNFINPSWAFPLWQASCDQTVINSLLPVSGERCKTYIKYRLIAAAISTKTGKFGSPHWLVNGPQHRSDITTYCQAWIWLVFLLNHSFYVGAIVIPDISDSIQKFDGYFDDGILGLHSNNEFIILMKQYRVMPYGYPGGFNQDMFETLVFSIS